jgi:hypothetical protein
MAGLPRALSYYYELKLLLSFMMKVKSNRRKVKGKSCRESARKVSPQYRIGKDLKTKK